MQTVNQNIRDDEIDTDNMTYEVSRLHNRHKKLCSTKFFALMSSASWNSFSFLPLIDVVIYASNCECEIIIMYCLSIQFNVVSCKL